MGAVAARVGGGVGSEEGGGDGDGDGDGPVRPCKDYCLACFFPKLFKGYLYPFTKSKLIYGNNRNI